MHLPSRRSAAVVPIVLADARAAAAHMAGWLAATLGSDRRRAVCLSGGSTPRVLYESLAQPPYRDAIRWDLVDWFWCDERFVPATDARSNYRMAAELFLDRVAVARERIHPIPTGTGTPAESAAAYEDELKRFYGAASLEPGRPLFDIVLLGVGDDGHTASLFPGSPALEERTRWVAWAPGPDGLARITLTYPALESSRDAAFLVTGAGKREVMRRIAGGATDAPAAMLRPAGRVHWFVDRAAVPELA